MRAVTAAVVDDDNFEIWGQGLHGLSQSVQESFDIGLLVIGRHYAAQPQGLARQLGGRGCWCVFGVKVGHGLILAILLQVLGLVMVCVAQKTPSLYSRP